MHIPSEGSTWPDLDTSEVAASPSWPFSLEIPECTFPRRLPGAALALLFSLLLECLENDLLFFDVVDWRDCIPTSTSQPQRTQKHPKDMS